MKKYMFVAILLCLSLTACNKSGASQPTDTKKDNVSEIDENDTCPTQTETSKPEVCSDVWTCTYQHYHYKDGSGQRTVEVSDLKKYAALDKSYKSCETVLVNNDISDLDMDDRCVFQGCKKTFDKSVCDGVENPLFGCKFNHTHYGDGSGQWVVGVLSKTSMIESFNNSFQKCMDETQYGSISELPYYARCRFVSCAVD